jgi:rSAM/selenodomain-associated transferase 2
MDLSIIIPVLNEASGLPALFRVLAGQQGVTAEVVICDGGSTDGTAALGWRLAGELSFPVRIISTSPGRARQMNEGARVAAGETLLFLHADSRFADPEAVRKGLDRLGSAITADGSDRIAGHFPLRFDRQENFSSWGYYHFESKARLDRPECIHGDQGFLLRRSFFDDVGPFDPALPMLAETRFADKVRLKGRWLLLPSDIHTSARRFEAEGLRERQTLNAIITNFAAAGWDTFFAELPRLYPHQESVGRLDLPILLKNISRLMGTLPIREQVRLWYATGRYVRDNAWQLALVSDTRRNFRAGVPVGTGRLTTLACYDRWLDCLTDHPPGRVAAAFLTWLWLRISCLRT